MKKELIVICICILFLGVGLSSAVSVNIKPFIINNRECLDCNEEKRVDTEYVITLLNKVEVYSKILMVLSKNDPIIKNNFEELSIRVNNFINLINNNIHESLCDLLWGICICFVPFAYPLFLIMENSPENSLRYLVASFFFDILADIQYIFFQILLFFKCDEIYS